MKCNLLLRTKENRFKEVVEAMVDEHETYYGQSCSPVIAGVNLINDCGQDCLQSFWNEEYKSYEYSFNIQEVNFASWITSAGNWIQFSQYRELYGGSLGLFIEFQGRRHSLQDMARFLPSGYLFSEGEVRSMVSASSALPWECGVKPDSPPQNLDEYEAEVREAVLRFMRTGEESPVAIAKSGKCTSLTKPRRWGKIKIKDAPCVLFPRYEEGGPVPTWWVGPYEIKNSLRWREFIKAAYKLGINPLPELRKTGEWDTEFMDRYEVEALYSKEYKIDHTPVWGDDNEENWDENYTLILAETQKGDIVGVEISHP